MDFGALPPEINSARMYAGPGSGSMLAAAAAWNGLAAELHSGASSYGSVISELTGGPWLGPSSTAMAAAAAPYVAWMSATAGQAEQAAAQARAAASAYQSAFAMTVPPPVIAANRTQLASLTATNIFGQNTPAIAANEAQYGEMWAQDATAMYGYAGEFGGRSTLTPFTAAPQTTNPAGSAAQGAAVAQAAGTSTGTGVQSTLSQLISSITRRYRASRRPVRRRRRRRDFRDFSEFASGWVFLRVVHDHDRALGGLTSASSGFSLGSILDRSDYRIRLSPRVYGHIFGERRDWRPLW